MSGTAWDDTNRSLAVSGATLTTSAPVMDLSQTWNSSGTTFTGVRFNAAGSSSTNSAAASLLMDLQTGGTSRLAVTKSGRLFSSASATNGGFELGINATGNNYAELVGGVLFLYEGGNIIANINRSGLRGFETTSAGRFAFGSTATDAGGIDTILTRRGPANLRFGAADAAAPVAQTLSVQSIVGGGGTPNLSAAAYPFKITGAQGTGQGAGGSIIFQTAPAAVSSSSGQNGLTDALTIDSVGSVRVVRALTVATLPGTPLAGMIARVSDANTPVIGTTVAGSGAAYALVNYNGSNWTVIGV